MKNSFRQMCFTVCRESSPGFGGIAGYASKTRAEFSVSCPLGTKRTMQMPGMILQTRSIPETYPQPLYEAPAPRHTKSGCVACAGHPPETLPSQPLSDKTRICPACQSSVICRFSFFLLTARQSHGPVSADPLRVPFSL